MTVCKLRAIDRPFVTGGRVSVTSGRGTVTSGFARGGSYLGESE